ncbi:MAG: hypothetical protein AAGH89_13260 [Verrucomicrobiota bacterium]
MSSTTSKQSLLYPGSQDWEVWAMDKKEGWMPDPDSPSPAEVGVLAIPARSMCAFPLTVVSDDPAVVKGMIRVQLESRGIVLGDTNPESISYQKVASNDDGQIQILAFALLDPSVHEGDVGAEEFEPTAFYHRVPEDGILLWQELGRWVVMFARDTKPAHVQCLSHAELNHDALQEIQAIQEGLILQELINPPELVEIVKTDSLGPEEVTLVSLQLGAEVKLREASPLATVKTKSDLVPAKVAEARRAQTLKQRIIWGVAAAFAFYAIFLGAWAFRLGVKDREIATLQEYVDRLEPEAGKVRLARVEVEEVRPSFDYQLFPIELFSRCVQILPEEGIRLTFFEVSPGKIELKGEASNSTAAVSWKARLRSSESFREYNWDFPQPDILPDNRAIFIATGTLPGFEG